MKLAKFKSGHVYYIENVLTGAVYVGSVSATPIHKRWHDHFRDLEGGVHYNRYLQRAWNKYGCGVFWFHVVETILPEYALQREQAHIDFRKCIPKRLTYNVCPTAGSCLGVRHNAKTRRKLRQSHLGIRMSPEAREKSSRSHAARFGTNIKLCDPNGTVHVITNMRAFCRTIGTHIASLRKLLAGETNYCKGWTRLGYTPLVYTIKSPSGDIFQVPELKKFCIERGLAYKKMHYLLKGKQSNYKGWTVLANKLTGRRKAQFKVFED